MNRKTKAVIWAVVITATGSYADVFGTKNNSFTIDFVNIGNAGNPADTTGYGSVSHDYRIGKYEVTLDQFARARAFDNRISDGNEGYWNDGTRTVGPGAPASGVQWFEAAKFCNWLTSGDAYAGAYQFDGGGVLQAVDRGAAVSAYGTVYVLPTEDEWYKAAYYKPGKFQSYWLYANGSDNVADLVQGTSSGWNYSSVLPSPNLTWATGSGAMELNGTYDMMGNVMEWTESAYDGTLDDLQNDNRTVRGGAWLFDESLMVSTNRSSNSPTGVPIVTGFVFDGFRVAAIPEPSSIGLIGLIGGIGWFVRRHLIL